MNDLDLYAEKYLDHLAVMNFVPLTIKAHRYLLNCFRAFLEEMGVTEVAKVTPAGLVFEEVKPTPQPIKAVKK